MESCLRPHSDEEAEAEVAMGAAGAGGEEPPGAGLAEKDQTQT